MARRYSEQYDAYYDDATNQWLESLCRDPDCEFCIGRPTFAKKVETDPIETEQTPPIE